MQSWAITYPYRPWTVNTERGRGGRKNQGDDRSSGTWHKRAELTQQWRGDFKILAKEAKIPPLKTAVIEVHQITPTRVRPDPGSIYPAVKAAIDGLVDAKVIPDDGPDYIDRLTFYPAEVGRNGDKLILVVMGEPATAS